MQIVTASWFNRLPPEIAKIGISRSVPRGHPGGYRVQRHPAKLWARFPSIYWAWDCAERGSSTSDNYARAAEARAKAGMMDAAALVLGKGRAS